jgi:8-oxo-dGTP pyrophosphatase MutT (NUDIX family)
MEGKPLVIADEAPDAALPAQWLALRVDDPREIAEVARVLITSKDLRGAYLFPGPGIEVWKAFKRQNVRVKAAGGIVVDERGRLLAIRRLGRWDLPKGKVEHGESMDEAAVREVQEECGIDGIRLGPLLARTWHTYPRNGEQHLKHTDWFLMHTSSDQPLVPQHEEDIEEVRWVERSEASMLRNDTYASLLPVIAAWEELQA